MQTFLPLPNFTETASVLDYKRLGKQRIEAMGIIKILTGETYKSPWRFHPAVRMWIGYEEALKSYFNYVSIEWVRRGYKHNIGLYGVEYPVKYPPWFGDDKFHGSHRAMLLNKNPSWYSQFGWTDNQVITGYYWPVKVGG